ncbi:MAG: electron transfer flavoprotein subunit beta/FixA family protein [Anaerolineales bacterium]
MKIVVCVKQVPDTAAQVVVENGQVTWGDAPLVINPWDEFAVEGALLLAEAHGGDVTVLTMGDESTKEAVKHALAMGCKEAIRVEGPENADALVTAQALAAAIRKMGDVDLVAFGRQAVDGDNGVTPALVGRFLGWPVLSLTAAVRAVDGGSITVERAIEEGRQVVQAKLPAVLSFSKDIGEPRYPSFMGIRKAARANVPVWSLADVGLSALSPAVSWPQVENPPQREITTEIITGGSPAEIAEKLADKIMAEKVL